MDAVSDLLLHRQGINSLKPKMVPEVSTETGPDNMQSEEQTTSKEIYRTPGKMDLLFDKWQRTMRKGAARSNRISMLAVDNSNTYPANSIPDPCPSWIGCPSVG